MNTSSAQRGARLEPVVMTAVDLDEFAEPPAPLTHLEHALRLACLRPPQTMRDLQLTHTLARHRDPLVLGKLLGSQRRPEVGITCLQSRDDPLPLGLAATVVRRLAALARDQTAVSARPVGRN
jgi:hypothetical protein